MRFRFLNIPVTIQPTFWLFIFFFSFDLDSHPMQILLFAIVAGLSLLIHEYGHGLAALKFGRQPEITLEAFGGYASYSAFHLEEKYQFIITLCGPLFTALLIGISYYLFTSRLFANYWIDCFFYYMVKMNIYWLIVNLAPLNPLDGGKIITYLFKRTLGEENGEWAGLILGNITALVGTAFFLIKQNYVFALLFVYYGVKNLQTYQSHPFKRCRPNAFAQLNEAARMLIEDKPEQGQKIFRKLTGSKDGYIRAHALEGLAKALDLQGKCTDAYKVLLKNNSDMTNDGKCLFCKLAYSEKNYVLVTQYSNDIYQTRPSFETALLNAKAFARLDNTALATGWLNTAIQFEEAKKINLIDILTDEAFTSIAQHRELLRNAIQDH